MSQRLYAAIKWPGKPPLRQTDPVRWYNQGSLGSKATVLVLFALLVGGCSKRQPEPQVVYVQPPAPAASPSTKQSSAAPPETLTIEEPPPVPTPEAPAAVTNTTSSAPKPPAPARAARPRTDTHAPEEPAAPGTTPPADTPQAPALEPAASAASEDQIAASQSSIRRRIDGLNNRDYSTPADKQILDDARAFLNQSVQALKEHNLLKAQELADKSALLLDALEAKP